MYPNIKASNIRRDLEEKMTVVGYCRLSRDEDKENYASIEEQKRIIQDYATVSYTHLTLPTILRV